MGKERKQFFDNLPKNLTYDPVDVVRIGDRLVGEDQPVFIIAEVSANHRGDIKNALRAIELAAESGADAVKFQHLTGTRIASDIVVYDEFHGKKIGALSEFYRSSEMPYAWTSELAAHAKKHNIMFLSSPFDFEAVEVLEKAGVPAYKIASYELTDDIFLRHVAKKMKPIIISTGMAYLEEVAHAVRVIQEEGNNQIIILHCTSVYPPKSFIDLNLRAIETLREAFKLPIGYSDHSKPPYLAAPIAAVALGACVIEKHFTDTREGGSHDDPNSLEAEEFRHTVEEIRNTEEAISPSGIKQPVVYPEHAGDEVHDRWMRRSICAAHDISAGEILTEDMIITLRPSGGIEPKDLRLIIGKKILRDIKARSPISWDDFLEIK